MGMFKVLAVALAVFSLAFLTADAVATQDATAPALTVLTPSPGDTFSGTVLLEASASDNESGITGVTWQAFDGWMLARPMYYTASSSTWTFPLDTRGLRNDEYLFEFKAANGSGLRTKVRLRATIANTYSYYAPETYDVMEGIALSAEANAVSAEGDAEENETLSVPRLAAPLQFTVVWGVETHVAEPRSTVKALQVVLVTRYVASASDPLYQRALFFNHKTGAWVQRGFVRTVFGGNYLTAVPIITGGVADFIGEDGLVSLRVEAFGPAFFQAYGDYVTFAISTQ